MDDDAFFRSEIGVNESGKDEVQTAMNRFLQYARSPNQCSRQMVGRSALETLRLVSSSPANAATVLDIVSTVAEDTESSVRCEIMEFVPHLALMLSENPADETLKSLITSHLLPAVIKVLADQETQVVKMAESALLTMLEHCLLTGDYVAKRVWPVIKGRMQNPSVESSVSVITIMSKMAPWVGSEVTEHHFVPLLVQLSGSHEFLVRKVCASVFGEICTVVGTQVTESTLLNSFLKLCGDADWGVRKTCAEVFMSVSCACTLETRKALLAPTFGALLSDVKRWVQLAAFESLGPFITTFAEPSITVLGYNGQGELVLKHPHGFEFKLHSTRLADRMSFQFAMKMEVNGGNPLSEFWAFDDEDNTSSSPSPAETMMASNNTSCNSSSDTPPPTPSEVRSEPETEKEENDRINGENKGNEDDPENYNQFQFWRDPVLAVDLNGDIVLPDDSTADSNPDSTNSPLVIRGPLVSFLKKLGIWNDNKEEKQEEVVTDNGEPSDEELVGDAFKTSDLPSPTLVETEAAAVPDESVKSEGKKQDIVPEELINHFVSMSDPKQNDQTVNLAHHCAYNLPAVALTLGPDNWALLKDTYETLAADRQWKVRRIVASSIHELAVIVGEDVATQDLVPVFTGFIKDLDEVRIGALKHLAHFLKLLRPAGRNSFLPRLAEFLMTDYDWNWRFREELAEQLLQALGLFSPHDTSHYLTPVVMTLLLDKVADVRKVALYLVTELVWHVSCDLDLVKDVLGELAKQFARSSLWNRRQTFAMLCSRLINDRVLSEEMFCQQVMPHLLDLSWDRVPNVRLTVARTIATDIMANEYFVDATSPHHEVLTAVLKRLQNDKDRDVRYFASLPPRETTSVNQKESSNDRRERFRRT